MEQPLTNNTMKLIAFLILSLSFICGFSLGRLSKRLPDPIAAPQQGNLTTLEYRIPGPEAKQEPLSFTF